MKINIKTVMTHSVVGFVCLIFGMVSKVFFTWDMYNIDKDERGYILELSLKNPKTVLIFNTPQQIDARVDYGMNDLMIDLTAPPPLREMLNIVNKVKNKEKKILIEKFQEYLKNEEKKTSNHVHINLKEEKDAYFKHRNGLCCFSINCVYDNLRTNSYHPNRRDDNRFIEISIPTCCSGIFSRQNLARIQ